MPNAADEAVPAEVAYVGEWRIEPTATSESVTFYLSYQLSQRSGPTALAQLGLTTDALCGPPHPLRFDVRREAGTFVCRGTAGEGRGTGAFRFEPDPAYANAIAATGMPSLGLRNHIFAGMFDVSSAFVRAIAATGLPHVTIKRLGALQARGITAEDVHALHDAFPSAGLDELVELGWLGVTAATWKRCAAQISATSAPIMSVRCAPPASSEASSSVSRRTAAAGCRSMKSSAFTAAPPSRTRRARAPMERDFARWTTVRGFARFSGW